MTTANGVNDNLIISKGRFAGKVSKQKLIQKVIDHFNTQLEEIPSNKEIKRTAEKMMLGYPAKQRQEITDRDVGMALMTYRKKHTAGDMDGMRSEIAEESQEPDNTTTEVKPTTKYTFTPAQVLKAESLMAEVGMPAARELIEVIAYIKSGRSCPPT